MERTAPCEERFNCSLPTAVCSLSLPFARELHLSCSLFVCHARPASTYISSRGKFSPSLHFVIPVTFSSLFLASVFFLVLSFVSPLVLLPATLLKVDFPGSLNSAFTILLLTLYWEYKALAVPFGFSVILKVNGCQCYSHMSISASLIKVASANIIPHRSA